MYRTERFGFVAVCLVFSTALVLAPAPARAEGIRFDALQIPAVIAGTAVYFMVTPVLAYAMTQAVGKAFIMHFESGGTFLDFSPAKMRTYYDEHFTSAKTAAAV